MRVKDTSFSWVILVTGVIVFVGSVYSVAHQRDDQPLPEVVGGSEDVGLSRGAIWAKRLQAIENQRNGQDSSFQIVMEGSNPTGSN